MRRPTRRYAGALRMPVWRLVQLQRCPPPNFKALARHWHHREWPTPTSSDICAYGAGHEAGQGWCGSFCARTLESSGAPKSRRRLFVPILEACWQAAKLAGESTRRARDGERGLLKLLFEYASRSASVARRAPSLPPRTRRRRRAGRRGAFCAATSRRSLRTTTPMRVACRRHDGGALLWRGCGSSGQRSATTTRLRIRQGGERARLRARNGSRRLEPPDVSLASAPCWARQEFGRISSRRRRVQPAARSPFAVRPCHGIGVRYVLPAAGC